LDPAIPKELERICLKALSKRACDRYTLALDMKEDLRHFLDETTAEPKINIIAGIPDVSQASARVVPKGLRAFEPEDSDFFLDLIPGARDREGLPQSIRFWKSKIESVRLDETFRIGLIYGPSGCGKSSLIKAGLLPRLPASVVSIYIDCSAMNIEARLVQAIRRECPQANVGVNLVETLADLRRNGLRGPSKVVVFLDQFEHWLHQRAGNLTSELTAALRHCDGQHVQCVLMIRDDFWLAVSRFLDEVEIDLLEGQNTTFVDLFSPRHARRVLVEYGRAYGCLPSDAEGFSSDQNAFLDRAIEELSQGGKVVPVRLSLFAEMIKARPWTHATWKETHGTEGVGEQFLDELFTVSGNPKYRQHQQAARRVLKSLLPASGTDIRATMRTLSELRTISGYQDSPREFDDLMRILDRHTRLVSPVDPEGVTPPSNQPGDIYYQLTHDYLVHSLRNWLTREQRKDRRGRAELLLAERTADWQVKGDDRSLPNASETLRILVHSSRRDWSQPQSAMMKHASRRLCVHALAVLSLAIAFLGAAYIFEARSRAQTLFGLSLDRTAQYARQLWIYGPIVRPSLQNEFALDGAAPERKRRAGIALVELNDRLLSEAVLAYLTKELLGCPADEFPLLRQWLQPFAPELPLEHLWDALETSEEQDEILRAASALAALDPEGSGWYAQNGFVVNRVVHALLSSKTADIGKWIDYLEPVSSFLLPRITFLSRDPDNKEGLTETERVNAVNAIIRYVGNPIDLSKRLLLTTTLEFNVIYDELVTYLKSRKINRHEVLNVFRRALSAAESDSTESAPNEIVKDRTAKQKVIAAIALLRMGEYIDDIRKLLTPSSDPRAAGLFIDYAARCGITPAELLDRYREETDPELRQIWIKCLGGRNNGGGRILNDLAHDKQQELSDLLLKDFKTHRHRGVHSAAQWLLSSEALGRTDEVRRLQAELKENEEALRTRPPIDDRQWYVSQEGLTFNLIETEDKDGYGPYTMAVSASEVTKEQFQQFMSFIDGEMETRSLKDFSPTGECPVLFLTWYEAAAFCNWLSEREGIPQDQWRYRFTRGGQVLPTNFITQDWEASGRPVYENFLETYWDDKEKKPENLVKVDVLPEQRTGYALPREHEWRFAALAGASTRFCFGSTDELLGDYACYCVNSPQLDSTGLLWERSRPVESKLPNRYGLFGVHGNAYEWCQPPWEKDMGDDYVSLGGSFPSTLVRLDVREPNKDAPYKRDWKNGMRVVRRYSWTQAKPAQH
jgi:hypothetical protein